MGKEGEMHISFHSPSNSAAGIRHLLDRCKQWPSERLSVVPKDTQDQMPSSSPNASGPFPLSGAPTELWEMKEAVVLEWREVNPNCSVWRDPPLVLVSSLTP